MELDIIVGILRGHFFSVVLLGSFQGSFQRISFSGSVFVYGSAGKVEER